MARAMWKGTIELGTLEIPVKLYAGVEERRIHFRLLHEKDRVPVRQRMVDPRSDEEVPSDEIRRGIEIEEGVFVVLRAEEEESLAPKPSRAIEVIQVVPRHAVDVAWYERPYYLGPDGSDADYTALAAALAEGGKLAIVRWVMRGQRYFGAIAAQEGTLALIRLHAADEVIAVDALEPPVGRAISAAERKLGEQLVAALEGAFDPSELRDEHRGRLEKLIAAKRRGKRYSVKETPIPRAAEDLGGALRRSLRTAKTAKRKSRAAA
jgi:DNA end-binding protein Ku